MKTENIPKERDVLRQLVKASDAIRKKHRALKSGREANEHAMHETFKPIVDPLKKLVNATDAANEHNKTPVKNELKETRKYETGEDARKELKEQIKYKKHSKRRGEAGYREREKMPRNDSFKPAFDDEEYHSVVGDDEMDNNNDDDDDEEEEILAANQTVENDPHHNEAAEELIDKYLGLLQSKHKASLDCSYGVRILSDDKLMIGDAPIDFPPGSFIYVGGRKYKKTKGLIELLFKKEPNESLIEPQDFEDYKTIVIATNAYKKFYRAEESIRESKSIKFKKYIEKMISGYAHVGEGMPQYKVAKKDVKFDYVYWDDPNELVERLRLLLASQAAGNSSHTNEIVSIIEELREAGIIY